MTFEFNTGITKIPIFLQSINNSFKEKENIRLLCYCVSLIQVKTNKQKEKADGDITLFPQTIATLNALTLAEYSNTVLKIQAGNQ